MADNTKKTTEKDTSANTVNLSKDGEKIMAIVEKMTVLELSELVKALEEKFGVSAAAPVMVTGAVGTADSEEKAEEKSEYDVVITSIGDQKIAVIKAVREIDQSLGLVDAKNLVEKKDAVILSKVKKEEAEEAKKKLEKAGATIEFK